MNDDSYATPRLCTSKAPNQSLEVSSQRTSDAGPGQDARGGEAKGWRGEEGSTALCAMTPPSM